MNRFLGDSPWRVLVKLIVLSFLVGIVMSVFGWTPIAAFYALVDALERVWYLGFSAFDRFFEYFLLGAVIVIPAFLLIRLASYRR